MPDLRGIFGAQIGAQKVAAFAAGAFAQFIFAQRVTQRAIGSDCNLDQSNKPKLAKADCWPNTSNPTC